MNLVKQNGQVSNDKKTPIYNITTGSIDGKAFEDVRMTKSLIACKEG